MHKKRSGCFVSFSAVALVATAGWFTIGGAPGVFALAAGHNPLTYTAPTPERIRETKQRAEAIIAALERFRTRTDAYPETLEALTAQEMRELPRPTVGHRQWDYSRPSPSRFVLSFFEGPIYERTWWDSRDGAWNGDH